jgi:ATP-dependent exoDNAse (exonuclease V) beta subunit
VSGALTAAQRTLFDELAAIAPVAAPTPSQAAAPDPDPAGAGAAAAARALSAEQEQAVARRRGPLLLAAGAGSGKTAVLVERFVRAVCEDGLAPGRILAITFTERAAGELRARIRARLLELGARAAARDTEGAPIETFHGFCARLLRVHALSAGLDPDFAILDEPGATRLAHAAFRRALAALLAADRPDGRHAEAVDLVAAYGADRLRAMLLGLYAEQRSRGIERPALPHGAPPAAGVDGGAAAPDSQAALDVRARRACVLLDETLRGFADAYAELKRARGALDFDDLELRARALLAEHAGVRAHWVERLELIMVDEFQDTNRRQLALLELLERDNLFTVGDELQSIYGFRHAEVELFRARRAALAPQGAALALVRTYRARPPLVEAVNAVFAERFGAAYTPLQAARAAVCEDETLPADPPLELLLTDKRGWAESAHARAVAAHLPHAPLWRQAEARLVAQRLAALVAEDACAAGEIAVLLRAASDLPLYERALQEQGLRTLAAVGSFWGHQQVGDLLAWLRALANPLDEVALYGTLASPLVGLSSDALALLALHARAQHASAWATLRAPDGELRRQLSDSDRGRLARFAEHFEHERRQLPALGAAELLLRALAATDYERHVRTLAWSERRLANVHKLLRLARRFEAAEGRGLRPFLEHVAQRGALAQSAEPHAPAGAEPDAVRLMTIHAAKGLEFPVVCVADLGRAAAAAPPDLLVDGARVGLRLASLDGTAAVGCLEYEQLCAERDRAAAAEEERIVYVALTRARERLLLSGAVDFTRWPQERPGCAPIAWLAPALAPQAPAAAAALAQPVLTLELGTAASRQDARGAGIRCVLNAPQTADAVLSVAFPSHSEV